MSTGREIRLTEDEDGHWTARDVDAEVTATGPTRAAALAALDEALADDEAEMGLGDALADLAIDVDVDSVAAVRELREDV